MTTVTTRTLVLGYKIFRMERFGAYPREVSSRPRRTMFKILPPFPTFLVLLRRRYQATKLYDVNITIFAASSLHISIFVRCTLF